LIYVDTWVVVLIAIIIVVLLYFIVVWVIRAHRRRVTAGREGLLGETAVVKVALEPKGVVLVEGELWTAITDKGRVEPEEEVIITKVEGLRLRVTKKA
jgi:membrane-bound serine protease (ClpP class)